MGLFDKLNSMAMSRMAKENFEAGWRRGAGCPGRPPASAVRAIQDAAETAWSFAGSGDSRKAVDALSRDLQRFADAVNKNELQVAIGAGTLMYLFSTTPGCEWASYYVSEWELKGMYK